MNRRTFFLGASAGMALVGNQAFAQRRGQSSSILTSELTGGEVDLADSGLEVVNHHIDEADGSEHIHFAVEGGQFDLVFWPRSSGDAADFVANAVGMYSAINPDTEELGIDTYEDGGWVAFDAGVVGYYEYQLGAYGDHDLIVTLAAPLETFEQVYEQAQSIQLDAMPPFLFSEDSGIVALAAERASATSSTSSRTGRNSRSSRSSTPDDNETETNSRTSSNRTGAPDPISIVTNHRSEFLESYDDFYAQLQMAAEETATDREVEDAFAALVNIAFVWQEYPSQATAVTFTPDLADLETTYLDWANAIGEMGTVFEEFYMGTSTVDDYLAVHDEWSVIDDELLAILDGLGSHVNHRAIRHHEIALSLAALGSVAR